CRPAGAMRHPLGSKVAPVACRPGHRDGTAPRWAMDPTIAMMQTPNVNRTTTPRRDVFVAVGVIARGLYGTRGLTSLRLNTSHVQAYSAFGNVAHPQSKKDLL